ncbi:hypothetical protein INR49_015483 [Caranx melampygus]|nr:hypothetical protein INR49_015483 [Caranx melampygus]
MGGQALFFALTSGSAPCGGRNLFDRFQGNQATRLSIRSHSVQQQQQQQLCSSALRSQGGGRGKKLQEFIVLLVKRDIKDISSVLGQDPQPLKLDHCDLLLDAIDIELGQLQVQPQNHWENFRKRDYNCADPPKWSESLSKDTGLGSTTQTNDTPMSCLDLIHTPMMEQTSERSTDCQGGPDTQEETSKRSDRWRRDKEEMDSRREQVIWRLKRLLGDTCKEDAVAGETRPPSESICTEDFVQRFKEEMVELALPSNMQHPGKEEEAESTNSDTLQRNPNGRGVVNVERRESTTPGKSSKETVMAHCSGSHKPGQQKGLEKGLPGSFGMDISHISDNRPQKTADDSSISHKAVILAEHENQQHNNSPAPKARCLAGVPVRSFDTVSIASDLDSVCTEQVRQHIDRLPGWYSLIQSVMDTDDYLTNQSDYDTLTNEESEPQPIHPSAQQKERETYSDNDKDTDEEVNHWSWRCRPKRTSEKMQSDWAKMKQRLTDLQQKCEKEEETLRLKRAQLKDIEFCLSELRQRRKHALQELEQLTAETAQMEKEKQILESALSDSRVERDSVSCHLDKLQKQRESCLHEIKNMEEELETLSQHRKSLKERNGVIMSMLEREEMDRQLDSAKTELFAEQRRARERLESVQEQQKEEEVKKLRKSLEQQREEANSREEELHAEASEKVHKAIEEERRKWEAEKVEAVQMHCGILEEQNRKGLESMRSEMQQEKSKAQALQHKVLELKTRVQELESESCVQQREQDSLLAVICKSLKEEHQAELQRLKKQMAQESQRTVLQLEQAVQLAVKEAERLQVTLGERDSSHNQTTADLNQQLRHWAQELGAECQHLRLLLEQSGAKQNSGQQPTSSTMTEALNNLRALREELQDLISHLHQELDSQKQTTVQLRKDKEQELSLQRQQLRLERDQALDSLKERLIQGGGVAVSLRKQLKAKDLELRHVQRSMSQWKEQTAARLACKFEEELTAELESFVQMFAIPQVQDKVDKVQSSVCSPGLHVLDSAASHSPSDLASLKLLRYLQSRVTQLRLENQTYTWSSSPPDKVPLDLSGSYLTTVSKFF